MISSCDKKYLNIESSVFVLNGSISNVEFFEDGNKTGEDHTYPYHYSLASLSPGNHSLMIKAYEVGGNNLASQPVNITIVDTLLYLPAITDNFDVLSAHAFLDSANYQWYLNNIAINNATDSVCNVQQNGVYTVVVTKNGCSATSLPFSYSLTGIGESFTSGINIYPNPAREKIYFSKNVNAELYNTLGESVLTIKDQASADVSWLEEGIYFIRFADGQLQKVVIYPR
jgi:hypothetical protein